MYSNVFTSPQQQHQQRVRVSSTIDWKAETAQHSSENTSLMMKSNHACRNVNSKGSTQFNPIFAKASLLNAKKIGILRALLFGTYRLKKLQHVCIQINLLELETFQQQSEITSHSMEKWIFPRRSRRLSREDDSRLVRR